MNEFRVESVSNTVADASMNSTNNCIIRVLGVGGCGGNSLQHMINQSVNGVEFIAINTDSQALAKSTAQTKVQIGVKLTNGLGAGCDPNKGRKAAEESKDDIKKLLQGSDMVFITAGMGGGTGTGAAPIIAEISKETGALTVAVVTKPFGFEGKRHMLNAEAGITELSKHVDSLIIIDNDKLLRNLGANISIVNAFNQGNDVLLNAVRGITDCITNPGFINLDFADVQTVMRGRGHAMIGNGVGQGANFVEDAIQQAIHSPLIDQVDISSAAGLLVNAKVNPNFPIAKWQEICDDIIDYADEEADCKFGMSFDENINEDQISITILITGISSSDLPGSENSVAVARAQASMRRNANIMNQTMMTDPNFYHMSQMNQQNRMMPNSSHMQQGGNNQMSQMPNQMRPQVPNQMGHQQQNMQQQGMQQQHHHQENINNMQSGEVRVGSVKQNTDNIWNVPPMMRQ